MFNFILNYLGTFAAHAAIGFFLVLALAWAIRAGAARLGWMARGPRGPNLVSALLAGMSWCVILFSAGITGLQTGATEAVARAIHANATETVLAAALEVGGPMGIRDLDQRFGLADARRLVDAWAPSFSTKAEAAIADNTVVQKASDYWQQSPEWIRNYLARQAPQTEYSVRELVELAWNKALAPNLDAVRAQIHAFAYSLAAILIVPMLLIELLWLWNTRRPIADTATAPTP